MLRLCLILIAFASIGVADDTPRRNLIDQYVFGKMHDNGIAPAPLSSDSEFLRRVYLDLTGRLPQPDAAKAFLADTDPDKRDKLIDSLFPKQPTVGIGRRPASRPFLDRWTYFFCDLFRVNVELDKVGISAFRDYIYKALEIDYPYDQFVRDLLTADAMSTWTNGPANFLARERVMENEGFSKMNHEDTCDEQAIWSTKLFLGVNTECISCHNGQGHLDKINLWLSTRNREDVWRQAAFFDKTSVTAVFGRVAEFQVRDNDKGYDLTTQSFLRLPRHPAQVHPTFILSGERWEPANGESQRTTFARLVTSHPQFARTAVNMIWAELMGRGIVDPPFDFDLARQDPKNPPPAPWKIQPSHPELLDALAEDFRKNNYDLRRVMKLITKSRAYQLSSYYPGRWKPEYEDYIARHAVKRLPAEQLWDAASQAAGVFESFPPGKVKYLLQTNYSQEYESSHKNLFNLLKDFGQTSREDLPTERSSMVQVAQLLNSPLFKSLATVRAGGRLESLLNAKPGKSDEEVVTDLFLATISRPPTPQEMRTALVPLKQNRQHGAEDLLWALINRMDFVFNL